MTQKLAETHEIPAGVPPSSAKVPEVDRLPFAAGSTRTGEDQPLLDVADEVGERNACA
jgi:hypothetical protein